MTNVRAEYARVRESYRNRKAKSTILEIQEARSRKFSVDWSAYNPPRPNKLGITAFAEYPLDELVGYIDWTPFFKVWELNGKYPAIFDDPVVGEHARTLHNDATQLLDRLVCKKLLRASAVLGLFPANAVGDDVEVYRDQTSSEVLTVLCGLRQQMEKPPGRPNLCLTDFVAPKESGILDHVGGFVVTAGHGLDELCRELESQHDDYSSIMAKALADRLAEAFAERMHERVRHEFWGYAENEHLDNDGLIAERYRGIRPAPGYPACPDHTEKRTLFRLLDAEKHTGVRLTDSCAMQPAASVSGWYLSHPEALYFGLGKIGEDQLRDYANRKRMEIGELERWLSSNLSYEPA